MASQIKIKRRQRWSAVPDCVLENQNLSFPARLTLSWMLGREDGWEIRVGVMCRTLGLTDKTWPRVRDELISAGFFQQTKLTDPESKKIYWVHIVTDDPLYPEISTPPNGGDGKTIPPKGRHGAGRDASGGDYHTELNHPLKTTTESPVDNLPAALVDVGGGVIDFFLEAAGNPQILMQERATLVKKLGAASEEQVRWAGAAWRETVERDKATSAEGLAVALCKLAAQGRVTRPKTIFKLESKQVADAQAERWKKLKSLAGRKYLSPAGLAEVNPSGTISMPHGAIAGSAALHALAQIENGIWRPAPT